MHIDAKHGFSRHALPQHGGARNRANRTSNALSLRQAETIIAAACKARAIGLPFNRFCSIHWEWAGLNDGEVANATSRFLKLATDWSRTNGVRIAWAWVRENDVGDHSKGSHVHIMLHSPASLPIARQFRRWLKRITGKPYRKGVIKSVSIGRSLNCCNNNLEQYALNLDNVLAYICKGVSPADGRLLGLPRTEPGGVIIGKRSGVAQCLGKNAGPYLQ